MKRAEMKREEMKEVEMKRDIREEFVEVGARDIERGEKSEKRQREELGQLDL